MPPAASATPVTPIDRLVQIETIYVERAATELARGQEVLARFPGARLIEVGSHWQIPGLHGNAGNVADWNRIKQTHLVLGTLKSPRLRPNGRSSDFIAPSQSNGCAMSCAYCYVPRRKGFANPITVFANIAQILRATERHIARQGPKAAPNQCDPVDWVYDIGENSDCAVDAWLSDNVRDYVELFARIPGAKASFATKAVNPQLLDYDPRGGTRVRFSLMPRAVSKLVDVRTHPIEHRIAAIDDFVAAGYEVHVNLSPVIVHDGWLGEWDELLGELDAGVGTAAKRQLAAEIIFLTHNDRMHEVNLGWHPRGEELLWTPGTQETKRSQTGGWNVRYRHGWKAARVRELRELIERRVPWLRVRYAF
ncbi:MAG: Spore photoproduct lyase [uncultured Solirubrobacteraceae bacterium]|uniref:Spore photoproduct lyase n=1 Tax=uncultured Solirubrobacteraceae bacterium TaxID=1162706 RepID=A0A6J4RTB8_9ACTN|nr:MAG: Spore photoproduct lyase [uncultured Solirubrobacteraceae bacterium]